MKFVFIPFTLYALAITSVASDISALEEVRREAIKHSKYLEAGESSSKNSVDLKADMDGFRKTIEPIIKDSCMPCHGPEKDKGDFRIDELDPDLVNGHDAEWWLDVIEVMTNNEMPPPEKDVELTDENRAKVIDWLSGQVQVASQVERSEGGHSSFRRMTRYEYSYALQDLLGLTEDFSKNFPPETISEDGFRNSSERMQMTSQQFSMYREVARYALNAAVYRDEEAQPVYFSMTMDAGGEQFIDWVETRTLDFRERKQRGEVVHTLPTQFGRALKHARENELDRGQTHFLNKETGEAWNRVVPEGFSLWEPMYEKPVDPEIQSYALVLPARQSYELDVGVSMPDRGMVKVRVRASKSSNEGEGYPSLSLTWKHDPKNTHHQGLDFKVYDKAVKASPGNPEFYEWVISLDGLKRNPFLRTGTLHRMAHPSEQIVLTNTYQGTKREESNLLIDYIEISTITEDEMPSDSYTQLFPEQLMTGDEELDAKELLRYFMTKAWRRPVGEDEVQRITKLYQLMRPAYPTFEEAMLEAYATVLTSSHFLYLAQSEDAVSASELASRLSFFLWGSIPDEELQALISDEKIKDPKVLRQQAERMLQDPRVDRFISQFTHQWLGLEMLEALRLNKKEFPQFSTSLKESMLKESMVLFQQMLSENASIIDFLHADYSYMDQRLAAHYGIEVVGNHFRKVAFPPELNRGGLLAQAGLLAMNSDGKDSHPLRRSIWLLENILHDPPPPPPPAVPEIDLTDPRILEMTLKERMEDHRNKPACASCHMKIDPWGIALEEFDAIGSWRSEVEGKPVDASSMLVDETEIVGIKGLKRYLLGNRQDHFAQAMVEKMACYALGRPLTFSDHSEIERITRKTREDGDGLKTLILHLIESDLFRNT
ncbi:DUF1592 domain-containing protein [Rubritalea sp.]|uniref:DUF1592 domain-containing protein n=1 Tax=Rubritalea sp. TaxID=2109375 RepID=UPI003EF173C3